MDATQVMCDATCMKIGTVSSDLSSYGEVQFSSDRGLSWSGYVVTKPGKWISLAGSSDARVLLRGRAILPWWPLILSTLIF